MATLGVDLGDRERLGLPAGVEQADGERFAHATTAEECQVHPEQANRGRLRAQGTQRRVAVHGRGRARGTLGRRPALPRTETGLLHLGPTPSRSPSGSGRSQT